MHKTLLVFTFASAIFCTSVYAGDVKAGKATSATCAGCHGNSGISKVGIYPNLRGQKEAYLKKQLLAFKAGTRKDPIMSGLAKSLTERDIENVSAYYASMK